MQKESLSVESVAEAYLALLGARGVDHLFANAGTDFPSIVEALAKPRSDNARLPRPVICPHENVAVSMAHGYTMVTGRAQAVMVHVNVGMANALCGLFNAERERIPMLFTAGRTPLFESGPLGSRNVNIHWAQEMFDQAGMAREAIKWDYELRDGQQIETVVDRALSVARSDPQGPVFLALPREVLARKLENFEFSLPTRLTPTAPAEPSQEAVSAAARLLAEARNPLVIVSAAGRDLAVPALLADLADRFALPVVEYRPRCVNLPSDHPMHLGFESEPFVADADVILVLDADVPWIPNAAKPGPDCRVIQAGIDPQFSRYPIRGFAADIAISGGNAAIVRALIAALARKTASDSERLAVRRRAIAEKSKARRERALASVAETPTGRMSFAWVSHCLDRARPRDSIVVNEYPLIRPVTTFDRPGTFFGPTPVGGLGWGLPAALGAQLASPGRVVIATLGDGSYIFANPLACHQVASAYNLPVLTVVFDNGEWGAVRRAATTMYPQGHAVRSNSMPLVSLQPSPKFEAVIAACGGWGERVEEAAKLPDAIARALHVVQVERRQALLSVAVA